MVNLPDAWVEDARNLDNAEQLLHSAHASGKLTIEAASVLIAGPQTRL